MKWCPRTDSNRGPIDYKSIALPAELQGHSESGIINRKSGELVHEITKNINSETSEKDITFYNCKEINKNV